MRRRLGRLLVWLCASVVLWAAVEIVLWPDVAELAEAAPGKTAFMRRHEARSGREISAIWVPYDEIAGTLKRAVLVAEDVDFFSHRGFAGGEIGQALREAIRSRSFPRGASTITQQTAKNLWLSPSRTPRRKLREVLLTRSLESHLEKKRILEIYLNVAEFGEDTFGCEAASRHFFGKSAADLTVNEAARLAAVLPRPGRWTPLGQSAGYLESVARIERRARRADWLKRVI